MGLQFPKCGHSSYHASQSCSSPRSWLLVLFYNLALLQLLDRSHNVNGFTLFKTDRNLEVFDTNHELNSDIGRIKIGDGVIPRAITLADIFLVNNSLQWQSYSIYLARLGVVRPVLDVGTLSHLIHIHGIDNNRLTEKTIELVDYVPWNFVTKVMAVGPPIPSLPAYENGNYDLNTLVLMQLINAIQSPLLRDVTFIGDFLNPSVGIFNDKYFILYQDSQSNYGNAALKFAAIDPNSSFSIVPSKLFDAVDIHQYPCIENSDKSKGTCYISGGDPRVTQVNSTCVVISATTNVRMKISVLHENPETKLLRPTVVFEIEPDHESSERQKNWTPFIHRESLLRKNQLMYIQTINPLRVIAVDMSTPNDEVAASCLTRVGTTVSVGPHLRLPWHFGHPRGGTQAILVPDTISGSGSHNATCYLSIFHSVAEITSGVKSYFMGAFTFTPNPPFKLLSISDVPIINSTNYLYDGSWNKNRGPFKQLLDYVLFPTNLELENEQDLLMTFGWQDSKAYVARMKLSELMHSLVLV